MSTLRDKLNAKIAELEDTVNALDRMMNAMPANLLDRPVKDATLMSSGWLRIIGNAEQLIGLPSFFKSSDLLRYDFRTHEWRNGNARHKMTFVTNDACGQMIVDLERMKGACVKARVLAQPREMTIEFCGKPPDGYEIIEVLGLDE